MPRPELAEAIAGAGELAAELGEPLVADVVSRGCAKVSQQPRRDVALVLILRALLAELQDLTLQIGSGWARGRQSALVLGRDQRSAGRAAA